MGLADNKASLEEQENYYLPKEIKILQDKKIKKIKVGFKHCLFYNESEVFFSGDTSKGALGIKLEKLPSESKIKNNILKLTRITQLLPICIDEVKSFYCGWHNSFILTSKF